MNGAWGQWSGWSGCAAGICAGNQRIRTRTCTNPLPSDDGMYCDEGESSEQQDCKGERVLLSFSRESTFFKTVISLNCNLSCVFCLCIINATPFQLTVASQNGVSGHFVRTRAGDPQSTGQEHVLTPPLFLTGSLVLEIQFKRSLSVLDRVQVSRKRCNSEPDIKRSQSKLQLSQTQHN